MELYLHLVLRLKMDGAIPPFLNTLFIVVKNCDNVTFHAVIQDFSEKTPQPWEIFTITHAVLLYSSY
jgi:hypothetical protein